MSMNMNGETNRTSVCLTTEQISDLAETFDSIDINGDGVLQLSELKQALHLVGLKLPDFECRQIIERFKKDSRSSADEMTFSEFRDLYTRLKSKDYALQFKKVVHRAENLDQFGGMSDASNEGIVHSVRHEEQVAFSDWINSNLTSDSDLQKVLPIDREGKQLYSACSDGLIICKLINLAVPETIDERAINKKNLNAYTKRENQTLALNSALSIGCNIVNIDADDLAKGKQHLVLGLLWQIIRIGLFNQINLVHVPGLVRLLQEGETLADLQKLSPEQILLRWVNYHLEHAQTNRRMRNFMSDIQDSHIYAHLLNQIAPPERGVGLAPLNTPGDNVKKAEAMLLEADKLDCRAFVTANDVANGVYKLNLAFVANLFNTWPGLKPPGDDELIDGEIVEETREEKAYRNWMNSMGVKPFVNYIYSDLTNGIIIFQLYDVISPGMVDWKRVVKEFNRLKAMMDQIQNCNYAVELGKQLRFSLVGIQGKDIYDGNRNLTLALVWQMMRAYTLTVLAKCTHSGSLATDKEILDWANKKLHEQGKDSQVRSFQDSSLSNAKVFIDLIDAIQHGLINYEMIKEGHTTEEKLDNAKYAISMARKMGAKVYALPEDIVEVKPKMIMTVFACLMMRDYLPNVKEQSSVASSPSTPFS